MKKGEKKMQNKKNVTFTAFLIIVITVAWMAAFIPMLAISTASGADLDDNYFSIMQISDTQFLSVSYPTLFNETIKWIANNSASYNLKMVVHTGDIVDNINGTSGTYSDPAQWDRANSAMNLLADAGVPYCWDAGNHDQIPWNDANGTWLGSNYPAFNVSNMRSKPYWVSDFFDSKNTAVKLFYKGYPFLIINLEYMATNATINWMKTLLDNNKDANVIVAAHTYLNKAGGYGFSSAGLPGEVAWCNNFKIILDGYPNIFLTLSGHDPSGTANMTRLGSREEVFFNRQGINNQTGAAAVRIYTFDLTNMNVSTSTYAYVLSNKTWAWLTDVYNQFSFNVTLSHRAPLSAVVTSSGTTVTAGNIVAFYASVSGGAAPYTYQWYQGVTPVGNSAQIAFYPSSPGTYTYYCKITDADGTTSNSSAAILTVNSAATPVPTQPQSTAAPTTETTPSPSASSSTPTPTPASTQQPTPTETQAVALSPEVSPTQSQSTPSPKIETGFTLAPEATYAIITIVVVMLVVVVALVIKKRGK
jgi:hypothetical protein